MDVKFLISVVFLNIIVGINSFASEKGLISKDKGINNICYKLYVCDDKDNVLVSDEKKSKCEVMSKKGEKGDKGSSALYDERPWLPQQPPMMGEKGIQGTKGEKGDPGHPGYSNYPLPSMPEYQSAKGDRGDQGFQGLQGPPGEKGSRGHKGPRGLAGHPGKHGAPGPSGLPGLPGVGVCTGFETDDGDVEDRGDAPMYHKACKYLPPGSESDYYSIAPTRNVKIDVYCNMTTLSTCIKLKTINTDTINEYLTYKTQDNFWLSDHGLYLDYGVSDAGIIALQSLSSLVTQKIRYHCKNSHAYYNGRDLSNAIGLYTWDNVHLKSNNNEDTPLYYSIDTDKDGCKTHVGNDWKYSEIALHSTIPTRLPIKDIYVRDTRFTDQAVFIELKELCFT